MHSEEYWKKIDHSTQDFPERNVALCYRICQIPHSFDDVRQVEHSV